MNEFLNAQTALQHLVLKDHNRLAYHLMPPVGWMNDPNGLLQKNGMYHLFYQYSPGRADGKSSRGWGHYSTLDFVHYTQEQPMLFPDSELDFGGAYSGSAFEKDGLIHFYYTGNGKYPGDYDYINEGRQHWVCHFTSPDGFSFSQKELLLKNEDYPQDLSCHVRDPKVIEDHGKYYMVLGSRTRDSHGQVNVFESEDLLHFRPVSVIRPKEDFGYMWECPDVFDLNGTRILITCPQGVDQDGYLYENVYQNGYFILDPDLSKDQEVENFAEFDNGFDFYAPQSFEDESGRRILIGWMGLPDTDYSNPTTQFGWQHAMTLPRKLEYKNDRLYQYPVEELKALRKKEQSLSLKPDQKLDLPSSVFELHLDTGNQPFEITLRNDVSLSWDGHLLCLDMHQSGSGRRQRHIEMDEVQTLDIFSDTSSLEIFVNEGQRAMTTRIYDTQQDLKLISSVPMKGTLYELDGFTINTGAPASA